MQFSEIISEMPFGSSHGFPGFGLGLFRQAYYEMIANRISGENGDAHVKEFLANWFADIFGRDSGKFKRDAFLKAALSDHYRTNSRPTFQQRHFWYIAPLIKQIGDAHAREFVAHWVADKIGSTNGNFRRALWDKACGLETEEREELPSHNSKTGTKRHTLGYDRT